MLAYPAFREIYVNTRSHTQLAGDLGDGDAGIRPKIEYRTRQKPVRHLGIDLGFAPSGAARNPVLREADSSSIADWMPGEWTGACQTPDCPSPWHYSRNQEIAMGIRMLLRDLAAAFPRHRLRVVIPERQSTAELLARESPTGTVSYTSSRNNYLPNIGEEMTMVDLSALRAEPVLPGVGPFVDPRVLDRYLEAVPKELPGAAAPMHEGQWTLPEEAGRRAREQRVCQMLSRPEISEVIVYEAADWAYRLPWDGWQLLDRCAEILRYGAK